MGKAIIIEPAHRFSIDAFGLPYEKKEVIKRSMPEGELFTAEEVSSILSSNNREEMFNSKQQKARARMLKELAIGDSILIEGIEYKVFKVGDDCVETSDGGKHFPGEIDSIKAVIDHRINFLKRNGIVSDRSRYLGGKNRYIEAITPDGHVLLTKNILIHFDIVYTQVNFQIQEGKKVNFTDLYGPFPVPDNGKYHY